MQAHHSPSSSDGGALTAEGMRAVNCFAWNHDHSSPLTLVDAVNGPTMDRWIFETRLEEHDHLASIGLRAQQAADLRSGSHVYVWTLDTRTGKWKPELVLLRFTRGATCCKWSPDAFATTTLRWSGSLLPPAPALAPPPSPSPISRVQVGLQEDQEAPFDRDQRRLAPEQLPAATAAPTAPAGFLGLLKALDNPRPAEDGTVAHPKPVHPSFADGESSTMPRVAAVQDGHGRGLGALGRVEPSGDQVAFTAGPKSAAAKPRAGTLASNAFKMFESATQGASLQQTHAAAPRRRPPTPTPSRLPCPAVALTHTLAANWRPSNAPRRRGQVHDLLPRRQVLWTREGAHITA
ncbi:hypothetical protein PAPYR_5245 [Paratrimastix pyriformis]|uniref:Uncharacterized protein n=1 Tax=Paratrimastix pyriformis TaxID=342808 RepID=A0ABQ8UMM4_9EUKA|nr:hypothetical protein PAPYR_5245 [Paratrimastix pyriformis]